MTDESGRVRRIAVRGIEVEVEEHGEGPRPFVLVHGFTGSRDDWREQLPRLAALGHTVAIDQRGHGGSTNTGRPEGYDLATLADDFRAVLDALGISRCDLLGHSMGGMMTLRFVLDRPAYVSSLVLMDTSPRPLRLLSDGLRDGALAVIAARGMSGLAEIMQQGAARDERRPAAARACEEAMGSERFWSRIRAKLEAMDPVAFDCLGRALAEHESVVPRLGEISCPTLVMVGEQDRPFHAPSDEMASGIPHAKRVTISDAAHSPQLENADAWFEAVSAHLRSVRAPGRP